MNQTNNQCCNKKCGVFRGKKLSDDIPSPCDCECHTLVTGAPSNQFIEDFLNQFAGVRTKAISEMFDNPDENGIFPTTDFFNEIDSSVREILTQALQQGAKEEREAILAALPKDEMIKEWQNNLTPEADLEWFASGAIKMRMKIRQILSRNTV